MTAWWRSQGDTGQQKRGARRLRTRGLERLSPQPRMREPQPAPRVYPYVRRDVPRTRGKQGGSTDIPSMRLQGGCMDLVAVMDGCSRDVRSWAGSSTMDVGVGLAAFAQALAVARPDIFTSDQGAQCTRLDFTGRLASVGIHISMDGRGRALDHVFVARLWRTVKYEEVYWGYASTPSIAISL